MLLRVKVNTLNVSLTVLFLFSPPEHFGFLKFQVHSTASRASTLQCTLSLAGGKLHSVTCGRSKHASKQSPFTSIEPLQAIVDSYARGEKAGQQSGDYLNQMYNKTLTISTYFASGQNLGSVCTKIRSCLTKKVPFTPFLRLLHVQAVVLMQGLHMAEAPTIEGLPGEAAILANPQMGQAQQDLLCQINNLMRAFLFCKTEDLMPNLNISETLKKKNHSLLLGYIQAML